jgi:opacity protein-like surface antigen
MKTLLKSLSVATIVAIAASSALASEGSYNKSVPAAKAAEKAKAHSNSSKLYVKGQVSYNFSKAFKAKFDVFEVKAKAKNQFGFGAGIGYEIIENLRLELMLNYAPKKEYKVGSTVIDKLSIFNPMIVAHYDIGSFNGVTPFVSAGLGATKLHSDNFKFKTAVSALIGAGVSYELTQDVAGELAYNYTYHGKWKDKEFATKTKLAGHSVIAAVRVKI